MAVGSVPLARAAVLSIGLTLLGSSIATAQTTTPAPATASTTLAGTSIPEYARPLEGKKVRITADGKRVSGVVTSASPEGLVLAQGGTPLTIPYNKVEKVQKSTHRLRNGALIGFGVGAGLGVLMAATCAGDECAPDAAGGAALGVGMYGAGIGLLVGAIRNATHKDTDVLYQAPRSTTTVSVAPIFSNSSKGVAFSMSWR